MNYVGDCDGTIYLGEVKTCTVGNYIYFGFILESQTGNAINGATTGTISQSNNATTTTTTQSSNVGGTRYLLSPIRSFKSSKLTN